VVGGGKRSNSIGWKRVTTRARSAAEENEMVGQQSEWQGVVGGRGWERFMMLFIAISVFLFPPFFFRPLLRVHARRQFPLP